MTAHSLAPLRALAWLCLCLMGVVVVASAFLRHHGAGDALQAAWAGELALARLVHRIAASVVLLGAVAMMVAARRAGERTAFALAAALFGVALLLSAVGLLAGASRSGAVVLVNLLGGFAMLGLCARLAAQPSRTGIGRAAWTVLGLVALQAAGGALASAHASPDCVGLTDCSPFALLHRVSGVLLAFGLMVFGLWAAWRRQRVSAAVLALLALLLLLLGVLLAGIGSTTLPPLVVLHNALAAAAVVILVRLL
jgi:hypothetical protein